MFDALNDIRNVVDNAEAIRSAAVCSRRHLYDLAGAHAGFLRNTASS
ncbi:MAG: hypothetical protein ACLSDQ_00330 [Adlercreutzia equolifaciens]